MVVVAIAATITVASLSGSTVANTDAQAQTAIQGAVSAASTYYNNTQQFPTTSAAVSAIVPGAGVTYVKNSPSYASNQVSFAVDTFGLVFATAALGANNMCWYETRNVSGQTPTPVNPAATSAPTTYYHSASTTSPASCLALTGFISTCDNSISKQCPTTTTTTPGSTTTTLPPGSSLFMGSQISTSGLYTSCAVSQSTSNYLYCWGLNDQGQLGIGAVSAPSTQPYAVQPRISNPLSISVHGTDACAVNSTGTSVSCWGSNNNAELAIDPSSGVTSSATPVTISGLPSSGITAVSAANPAACALISSKVWCWGYDAHGEAGVSPTPSSGYVTTPTQVQTSSGTLTGVTQIATGNASCALVGTPGTVWCWGYNGDGELGNGSTTDSSVAVQVTGITNAVAISSGKTSACAILATGSVNCWGSNLWGQLGNSSSGPYAGSSTPVTVSAITTAAQSASSISVGANSACAVLASGALYCWGYDASGQLGNGGSVPSTPYASSSYATAPTAVQTVSGSALTNVSAVSIGDLSACALTGASSGGNLWCWGHGTFGELGNGSASTQYAAVPVYKAAN